MMGIEQKNEEKFEAISLKINKLIRSGVGSAIDEGGGVNIIITVPISPEGAIGGAKMDMIGFKLI